MKNWKKTKLFEICEVETGYRPSRKETDNTGYFSLGGEHITEDHQVNYEKNDWFISKVFFDSLARGNLNQEATLFVKDGATIGKCAYFKPSRSQYKCCVNEHLYKIISKKELCVNRFLYYIICSPFYQAMIKNCITGAAQPGLNRTFLSTVEISLPNINIQRKIASILSAYDDLIENNLHRIQILEEMAQLIYQEWFVSFRFPGYEKVKFIDSELGKIPEGWKRSFKDFVDFKEGPGIRSYQYKEKGIPFLNIRTLSDNDIDFSKVQYVDEEEVNTKYKHFLLEEGDHVVSSSGTLGRIVTIQDFHLPLMLNTSIIRMRPKTNNVGRWQLKHFLKSDYFQNQILSLASGVAQMNYGPTHLKEMFIFAPNEEIGKEYENIVSPLELTINNLVKKNEILRETRDLLLPKLISGELDISDLDIVIRE